LQDPELIFRIVSEVRRAVAAHVPVSAKMRLGFNDDTRAEECAQAIADAGASEIVVHARTKAHGYKPPAYWERIADVRSVVKIPMVANGEVWSAQDAERCRAASGCDDIMIGRGMVADPGLALAIRRVDSRDVVAHVSWQTLRPLIRDFWRQVSARVERKHRAGRLKQWLNFLRRRYPEAQAAYDALRTINDPLLIDAWLAVETDVASRDQRVSLLQTE
jgi:tRNA-dihydrouridine synthase C